jgi:hypothetical protein
MSNVKILYDLNEYDDAYDYLANRQVYILVDQRENEYHIYQHRNDLNDMLVATCYNVVMANKLAHLIDEHKTYLIQENS